MRLLKAAAELFYGQGVGATGIDAVTARAGVAKMSLYNNFASKAELVESYLEARREEWQVLYRERLSHVATPRDRILAIFDSYLDHAGLAYEWGFRGCGLLNGAAELPVGNPGRTIVALQKQEVEHLFRDFLVEIRPEDGALAEHTAEHLSFLLEGSMARAGLDGNDSRLRAARRIAVSILDTY